MSASVNGIINITEIKRVLTQEVEKSDVFKDLLIDNIVVKSGYLIF